MFREGFSASICHSDRVIEFKIRDYISSRDVVEEITAYWRNNRDYAGYNKIMDLRFWNGYLELQDIEWMAKSYIELFDGAPPPIKVAILTFNPLEGARSRASVPLFSHDRLDQVESFETVREARAWITM